MDDTVAKGLKELVELTPVPGEANVYTIHFKVPPGTSSDEMTEQDWDKFEKDIADSCEQIP